MLDKPVTVEASTLCADMSKAPLGEPVWALTIGGVLVKEVLTARNIKYYTQWGRYPKKEKQNEIT